jgi:hypothetical protein
MRFSLKAVLFLFVFSGLVAQAIAGGSARREQIIAQYKHCAWTNEMGQELYQCIRKNNGFSTLWCFNTTIENNCEKDSVTQGEPIVLAKSEAEQEQDKLRASRMGEENVVGTTPAERQMLKYRNCPITDEMGAYMYECVKANNGFGTHGCFDQAKFQFCEPED